MEMEVAETAVEVAAKPKTLLVALGVAAFCGSIYGVGKLVGKHRARKAPATTEVIETTAK